MDYIVRETCSEIRGLARFALRGNWQTVAIAVALYYFLLNTIPLIIEAVIPGAVITQYNALLEIEEEIPWVADLYSVLLGGAFEMGIASYFLFFVRRREMKVMHLFDGFEHFLKTLLLMIVTSVFTFLWALLLIVPGIIAALRYSQAFIILAENPELGVMECINRSKMYMKGNKGKYFCLGLSYLGWLILAAIPIAFVEELSGVIYIAGDFLLSIPMFFVMAYFQTGMIIFYELVSKNLVAKPAEEVTNEYEF